MTENQGGNISYFSRFLCAFSDIDYEDDFDNNFATDYIFTRNILRKKNYPILIKLEYFFKAFFLDKVHVGTKYLNNRFDFDKIKDFNGKIIFIVNKKNSFNSRVLYSEFQKYF